MLRLFFSILLLLIFVVVSGQETTGSAFFRNLLEAKEDSGSITIEQDLALEELVGIHIDANKRSKGIDGFRIQLYLGSNNNAKKEATDVKGKLLSLFPDEKPYIMYEAPFWRVQVGDFRSKNEALGLYRKLKKEFPSCYPVPVNNISLESLK